MSRTTKVIPTLKIYTRGESGNVSTGSNICVELNGEKLTSVDFIKIELKPKKVVRVYMEMIVNLEVDFENPEVTVFKKEINKKNTEVIGYYGNRNIAEVDDSYAFEQIGRKYMKVVESNKILSNHILSKYCNHEELVEDLLSKKITNKEYCEALLIAIKSMSKEDEEEYFKLTILYSPK